MTETMNCPDCGVPPGRWHRAGCGAEQCPYCGEHLADCYCSEELPPLDERLPWSGRCSWWKTCSAFGFFEREVDGTWVRCAADDDGSQPDVIRLLHECVWNRIEKRFEPPGARSSASIEDACSWF